MTAVAAVLAAHVELSADGGGVVVFSAAVAARDLPLTSFCVSRVSGYAAAKAGGNHRADVVLRDLELHVAVLGLDLLGFEPLVLTRRVHKKVSRSLKSLGWRS